MMDMAAVRECIGTKRFVWIDDDFNDTPERLGKVLVDGADVTKACGFTKIDGIMEGAEFDAGGALVDVVEHLRSLPPGAMDEIRRRFFAKRVEMGLSGPELADGIVETVCGKLGIAKEDRFPFDEGIDAVRGLCGGSADADIGYIVDLNDARSDDNRGLDVIEILAASSSRGIAFILTHDTDVAGEAAKEAELASKLAARRSDGAPLDLPVCVIAKDRLRVEPAADAGKVEEPMVVALKRAGLRRCMHEVLRRAQPIVHKEFADAAGSLLAIPPEALDAFVVERSHGEGLSELHVVERALVAQISRGLRQLFGTDDALRDSANAMRRLRDVALDGAVAPTDPRLEAFRQAEIWEGPELINAGLAPVACGDVFECDMDELPTGMKKRRYLVVGQPCDIALRSDGKRDQEATFLVPMLDKTDDGDDGRDKSKTAPLPFTIGGKIWVCNLRNTTMARLAVLDLASFRIDGMVRVDAGQTMPPGLLPGQQAAYGDRTAAAMHAIETKAMAAKPGTKHVLLDPDLQLTLSREGDYRRIHHGEFEPAKGDRPPRLTWRLKRVGRIQMPYAAAMLEALSGSMSRRAFDLDFAKAKPAPTPGKPGNASATA